ncbi:hypothetical protein [Ramlibacter sp.]|uniref:hypothetical protein n=1 Tax=Ramlibacter sp. TaxID=1917967 RepID=UPI002C1D8D14|nr:hypothetical protein [Ramlibacter sp.]HWI81858.1 hypothetical protein [Ramlibacter sp.]
MAADKRAGPPGPQGTAQPRQFAIRPGSANRGFASSDPERQGAPPGSTARGEPQDAARGDAAGDEHGEAVRLHRRLPRASAASRVPARQDAGQPDDPAAAPGARD